MKDFRYSILAALIGLAVAGAACTQNAADETTDATDVALEKTEAATNSALDAAKEGTAATIDATEKASETAADATGNLAERTVDKTKEIAATTSDKTKEISGDVATKSKEVTATTGEVITDAWITTTVSAKFVDEPLLKGRDVNVDTDEQVVTLKGTVASAAAKTRAAAIAEGTEGVTRVVNQLVVKEVISPKSRD